VIRSAASKVMWVGRATVFMVGLAVILALVFGVASMALGADGQPFLLGRATNVATALTKLTGNVNGSAMQVVNSNSGADDTALSLSVQAGEAPMRVNTATKVVNLNADRVDDREASSFANATHTHSGANITSGTVADARIASTIARDNEVMPRVLASDGTGSGLDADKLDGKDSSELAPRGYAQVTTSSPFFSSATSKGVIGIVRDAPGNVYCFNLTFEPKAAVASANINNNATVGTVVGSAVDSKCGTGFEAAAVTYAANTDPSPARNDINFGIVFM
jgi:hypothetical protein